MYLLECGELIKRINDILAKKANKELQEIDITLSQIKFLCTLDNNPNKSATLKELEKYFGVTQATVAGIASRLEKKGYVIGFIDEKDKRIKHIKLSDLGNDILEYAKETIEYREKELLSALNDNEKIEIRRLLQIVYESIK
ncbi:MAG: MarR family winged helix-turn-helix transcriptional regulator [Lachnospirales bacterium]